MFKNNSVFFALLLLALSSAPALAAPITAASPATCNCVGFRYAYEFDTWQKSPEPTVKADEDKLTVWLNHGFMSHDVVADGWTIIDWTSFSDNSFTFFLNGQPVTPTGTRGTVNEFVRAGDMIGLSGSTRIDFFAIVPGGANPLPEPGTAALFGLGLLGAAGLRKRTRNP